MVHDGDVPGVNQLAGPAAEVAVHEVVEVQRQAGRGIVGAGDGPWSADDDAVEPHGAGDG